MKPIGPEKLFEPNSMSEACHFLAPLFACVQIATRLGMERPGSSLQKPDWTRLCLVPRTWQSTATPAQPRAEAVSVLNSLAYQTWQTWLLVCMSGLGCKGENNMRPDTLGIPRITLLPRIARISVGKSGDGSHTSRLAKPLSCTSQPRRREHVIPQIVLVGHVITQMVCLFLVVMT